jgi:hypothetical protein
MKNYNKNTGLFINCIWILLLCVKINKKNVIFLLCLGLAKTTARQQSVIKARLQLLMQNFFSAKSIY